MLLDSRRASILVGLPSSARSSRTLPVRHRAVNAQALDMTQTAEHSLHGGFLMLRRGCRATPPAD